MGQKIVLTGLRANNDLHIGNYFGALLPVIDLAKQGSENYQINLFVPDLHSITTEIDYSSLQSQIINNLRLYLAAGLPIDNQNVLVYRQSYIPAHSELAWILNCFTGHGEMARMTQFKDKSSKLSNDRIGLGLFNYPVLMAADILLYGAAYVPVGDDQTQHLEFTRDIAQRFNAKFGNIFTVPEDSASQHKFFGKDQGLRIRDLQNPNNKMSKSDETGKGVIFLSDSPEVITKKVLSATTDSIGSVTYDYKSSPGISNLLDIYQLLSGDKERFIGQTNYGELKRELAGKLAALVEDLQNKQKNISDADVIKVLETGENRARALAKDKLFSVQAAVGLR
jgi:tryptophanyl-tRNA synthetase